MAKPKDKWTPEEELSVLEKEQRIDGARDEVFSFPTGTIPRLSSLDRGEIESWLDQDPRRFDFADDDHRDHGVPDQIMVFADKGYSSQTPLDRQLRF